MPGVLILELLRAQISERRMESAFVVDLLDKVRKLFSDVLEAFEGQRIDRLDFSVFMKLSDQIIGLQCVAVDLSCVLRSSIGMMNASRGG